jgi:hypothetical protein
MTRAKHFRGILVELECGCTKKLSSSFYRLTNERVASIVGSAARRAHGCPIHGFGLLLTRYLHTVRL